MRLTATLVSLLVFSAMTHAQDDGLKSRAELTSYEETSRYDDVLRFFNELQKRSPLVRVETFGLSAEGRALPLVILSNPPISEPRDARASGKPIVFVFANIHAGEVEGKEAMQHIARQIALGDMRPLLDKLIILGRAAVTGFLRRAKDPRAGARDRRIVNGDTFSSPCLSGALLLRNTRWGCASHSHRVKES